LRSVLLRYADCWGFVSVWCFCVVAFMAGCARQCL